MLRYDCDNCYECVKNKPPDDKSDSMGNRFIVCPTCGNKRCPKATDHELECTNSNDPGQPGSRYE